MFGGKYLNPLNAPEILLRTDEFALWKYYIKGLKAPGRKFKSELREDKRASCSVSLQGSNYLYKDFKTDEVLNIFMYLRKKLGCSYRDALKRVNEDFGLNLNPLLNHVGDVVVSRSKESKIGQGGVTRAIQVKFRDWNLDDKAFWYDRYRITTDLLREYNVFPLQHYYIEDSNKETIRIDCDSITYGYWHGGNKWKIYAPFEDERKWHSNLSKYDYSGYDQLSWVGELLIITKSLKDVMVYRLFGVDAICPQGEAQGLQSDFIMQLRKRFSLIVVNYDNDEAGISGMSKANKDHGLPVFKLDKAKDISDHIYEFGKSRTAELVERIKEGINGECQYRG